MLAKEFARLHGVALGADTSGVNKSGEKVTTPAIEAPAAEKLQASKLCYPSSHAY